MSSADFNNFHVDVLIRFARAGAQLQPVADFAFELFYRFPAGCCPDFNFPRVASVVPGLPLAVWKHR